MALSDLFDDFPRLSVSEYTAAIKQLLEGRIAPCWVSGEVSNIRRQSSGHIYFTLKDAGAQIPCVMFRGQASRLAFAPADGMEVVAFGEISVYEPHGRYQLIARDMQQSGQGRLYKEFERLKRKLAEEGLFDKVTKRVLPTLPMRIAIVTSPTGAALQDFLRILNRREWRGCIHIYPTRVQGAGAAGGIVEAIERANATSGYDLIVVARGGGSIEDLWCFNEEAVARAIAASELPVVSAIGHEIDFTLSDFAADVRAETPSAAAELISSAYLRCVERLELAREGFDEAVTDALADFSEALKSARTRLKGCSPAGALENAFLRIDEMGTRLHSLFRSAAHERRTQLVAVERVFRELDVGRRVELCRKRLRELDERIRSRTREEVAARRRRLDMAGATLRAISPRATLERGFAILRTESGSPLTSVCGLCPGDFARGTLKDGEVGLQVTAVEKTQPSLRDEADS